MWMGTSRDSSRIAPSSSPTTRAVCASEIRARGRTHLAPPADVPCVKPISGDVIRLPVALDQAGVTKLRALVERAGYGTSITFDGSRIRRADSAGVQLLCALVLAAEGRGVTVSWIAVSTVLLTYVSLLGVGGVMRFDGVPADDKDLPDWVN